MNKRKFAFPLLILTTAIILVVIFKPALTSPNSTLFSTSVDPLKSYFNFSYYLKFDDGIKHDGINYPYGDHLQYINSHPLFVTVLKFVDQHIHPIGNYGVAFLNLSMIFSFLLGIPFLFLILKRFKLPDWYSFLIALIIGFLTPQFDRIHGHFEMVWWFFIPAFWYFLIRYREGNQKKLWASFLLISGVIGGFISAYFVAFYAIFLIGVLMADVWINRKNLSSFYIEGIKLFLLAAIPILIVKGLVWATDWVDDRPTNPWGFYVFHSNIPSIFFPDSYPLKEKINQYINLSYQWEGRAYVGLPASLLALSVIVFSVKSFFKKKKISFPEIFKAQQFQAYLIAAVLILLFSMCFPFKWGLGILLDLLPPLKQFRALGRFSWIFYYIFTIYSAYVFYQIYKMLKSKKSNLIAVTFLILVLGTWGYNSIKNIERGTRNLFNTNEKLVNDDDGFLARFSETGIDYQQYQAIFALPFASTNGDKLLFEEGLTAFGEAMKCSYHTGIPLIQSFSPRLSFSQSLSSIQLLGNRAIRKTRLDDMNDKPILLICTKQEMNEQEAWLQSQAKVFWEDEYITMSTLPIDVFSENHKQWLNEVSDWRSSFEKETMISTDGDFNEIIFKDFNEFESEVQFAGNGSIYSRRKEIELFNSKLPTTGEAELSFWLYFDTREYNMPQPILRIWDENEELISEEKLNNRQVHEIYGNWIRISTLIDVNPNHSYQLSIRGKRITADNLLIRPSDSNVLIKEGEIELFNNFPID